MTQKGLPSEVAKRMTFEEQLTRETWIKEVSGTIIRGTLKTPNSQLVTPISIKLQRPDGYD
jgi:hypothetical protein